MLGLLLIFSIITAIAMITFIGIIIDRLWKQPEEDKPAIEEDSVVGISEKKTTKEIR